MKIFLKIFLWGSVISVNAQNDTLKPGETWVANSTQFHKIKKKHEWKTKHSIFLQAVLPTMISTFSINYDRILFSYPWVKSSIRMGSNFPSQMRENNAHEMMLYLNVIIGKELGWEAGIGGSLIYKENYSHQYGAVGGVLMFRYQNRNGGVIFRIGLSPAIGYIPNISGTLYGISLGYAFETIKKH